MTIVFAKFSEACLPDALRQFLFRVFLEAETFQSRFRLIVVLLRRFSVIRKTGRVVPCSPGGVVGTRDVFSERVVPLF